MKHSHRRQAVVASFLIRQHIRQDKKEEDRARRFWKNHKRRNKVRDRSAVGSSGALIERPNYNAEALENDPNIANTGAVAVHDVSWNHACHSFQNFDDDLDSGLESSTLNSDPLFACLPDECPDVENIFEVSTAKDSCVLNFELSAFEENYVEAMVNESFPHTSFSSQFNSFDPDDLSVANDVDLSRCGNFLHDDAGIDGVDDDDIIMWGTDDDVFEESDYDETSFEVKLVAKMFQKELEEIREQEDFDETRVDAHEEVWDKDEVREEVDEDEIHEEVEDEDEGDKGVVDVIHEDERSEDESSEEFPADNIGEEGQPCAAHAEVHVETHCTRHQHPSGYPAHIEGQDKAQGMGPKININKSYFRLWPTPPKYRIFICIRDSRVKESTVMLH